MPARPGISTRSPVTLITGASAGIGAEFARLLAKDGHALVLTARRLDRLEALAAELRAASGAEVEVVAADLAARDAPHLLFDKIAALNLEVGTLINNAGFGLRGAFAEQPLDRLIEVLDVNIVALTRLTGLFLPGMIARGSGGIINLASIAAFLPGPYMAVYYASKAYVLSFSQAIAYETKGTGVVVTAVCPGPTQSEFAEVADLTGTRLVRQAAMSGREVARLAIEGHRAGKSLVITGMTNKLTPLALRFLPRALVMSVAAGLQRK
jgi:uncharacterized protein